ncbi:acyl-CoA dehydrogenase family protein [Leifsonia shinshuensis]|uniref:Acyl-CoA dehydrogenase family protein n=1 Tax=Leifsonia shinshuensis TaxID=150026 RepID=A0A7G6YA31_9MICO|nr:acyl-CoA dehydrogenase family protein [Leifsonia shinshuensis]QNE35346.1 acyl-CoA dehydrogenase family protein [Leifsonia shinshuensis]
MTIDFTLTDEQRKARQETRDFAAKHLSGVEALIAPYQTPEERLLATKPIYEEMVKAGLLRSLIPQRDGGTMTSLLETVVTGEELSTGDVSVTCGLFSTGLGLYPIAIGGNAEQRRKFLTPFLTDEGAPMASLAFSEAGGSANFDDPNPDAGVRTIARREGDEWVISGHKAFTTNGYGWQGEGPDLFTVACRVDASLPPAQSLALIVVPRPTSGLSFGTSLDTMGHRACLSPRVNFDEVRVPVSNVLGKPGDAESLLSRTFTWSGVTVGAEAVCIMQQAFDAALEFTKTNNRNGSVPIIEHQNVGFMLADIKMRLEAARYLVWKAAQIFDDSQGADLELPNMAKIYCSELAVQVVYDAMRVVGVESYANELPFTRLLQDVLALPLYDGGNLGMRRRLLHDILKDPDYDSRAAAENKLRTTR